MDTSYPDQDFGTISIKTNAKARSVIFRVLPGELKITVPSRISQKELSQIIEKHRISLREKKAKTRPALILDENFKLQTHRFSVQIFKTDRADFYFSRKEGILHIACPQKTDFEAVAIRELLVKGIERYLKADAKKHLPIRLKALADENSLSYNEVKINSSKTRWGSCSSRKSINLSFYLMMLPVELIDYVLLHELTHTLEMNHSPRFWAKLNDFSKNRSAELKEKLKSFKTGL
jgi:predicted metal-dependent hydrolase